MTAAIYVALAAISIFINICTQAFVVKILVHPHAIPISVCLGTATGLASKYMLDRKFIFPPRSGEERYSLTTFSRYAATGALTTVVFWGVEYGFHFYFNEDLYRYIGGAIGLSLGYSIKYQLDNTFVFRSAAN